jgi:peptidoglycan/xylan/chitin deacetylase (PgdA/CDA1 family)
MPDTLAMTELRIALTFDAEHPDRPRCEPGVQERLLEALDRLDVRATFFIQGRWAEAYPVTAARIGAAGHLVGSHGYYHVRMPLLSDDGLRTDIEAAETAISTIVGVSPKPWFRCPFGAGHDDPRVLGAIEAAGYRNVHWDTWAEDWEPGRTAAQIETTALDGALAHGDGAIVLLHSWPEPTVDAVPGLVARLRSAGASLVTLDVLLDLPTLAGDPVRPVNRAGS